MKKFAFPFFYYKILHFYVKYSKYYYAVSTEENKCSGKTMIINQYKTKINNNKFTEREKVKYLKELTVTCGEE